MFDCMCYICNVCFVCFYVYHVVVFILQDRNWEEDQITAQELLHRRRREVEQAEENNGQKARLVIAALL